MIKCIRKLLQLDLNRFFNKRNIILCVVFVLLLLILLFDGIDNYKNSLENIKKFQEIEAKRIKQYIYYTQYGGYGMNILFIPGPMSVISNFLLTELTSSINSAERISIFLPIKNKNLFSKMKDFYLSTAGYMLLIFGLFSVLLGFETFINREYLKFLAGLYPYKKLLLILLISRICLFILFLLVIMVIFQVCLFIKGINLFNLYFLAFWGAAVLIFIVLLLSGFAAGLCKSKTVKTVSLILIIFFHFFLCPGFVTKVVEHRAANLTSHYELNLEKLKLFMTIEKEGFEKFGKFKSGKEAPEEIKKFVKEAINDEFAKLSRFETKMRQEMSDDVSFYHFISSLFPTTFYRSVTQEISSTGFLSFLDNYEHTQELKKQFLDFYVEKKFFSESTPGKLESFVKDKENIFFAESKFPRMFLFGLLLTIFYTGILTALSFFMFKRFLFLPGIDKSIDFDLKRGKCRVCLTSAEEVKNFVYNHFYPEFGSRESIYICHPDHIPPDIKVKYLLSFVFCLLGKEPPPYPKDNKNMMTLKYKEKIEMLFVLLDFDYKFIIFNEIESTGFGQLEFLTQEINELKKRTSILYLTKHIFFASNIYDDNFIVPHPMDNVNL